MQPAPRTDQQDRRDGDADAKPERLRQRERAERICEQIAGGNDERAFDRARFVLALAAYVGVDPRADHEESGNERRGVMWLEQIERAARQRKQRKGAHAAGPQRQVRIEPFEGKAEEEREAQKERPTLDTGRREAQRTERLLEARMRVRSGSAPRVIPQAPFCSPKRIADRQRGILIDRIDLVALVNARRFVVKRRHAKARLGHDRKIGSRNDEIQTNVVRRAVEMMGVLALDQHATTYDAVEELFEFRRLAMNQAVSTSEESSPR